MDELAFQVTDPLGQTVICTKECWDNHIVSRHNSMGKYLEIAKAAITNPSFGIFKDAHYPDRQIYYYRISGKLRYLKVIVQRDNDRLVVVTAFIADSTKKGEELLWPSSTAS